mmetsp:Transcript_48572/g.129623  ORF Transcript_48572/g.129623 Transcript_48572/m.129623 type:complete len:212 (+) Transcript_48572:353-988(+)
MQATEHPGAPAAAHPRGRVRHCEEGPAAERDHGVAHPQHARIRRRVSPDLVEHLGQRAREDPARVRPHIGPSRTRARQALAGADHRRRLRRDGVPAGVRGEQGPGEEQGSQAWAPPPHLHHHEQLPDSHGGGRRGLHHRRRRLPPAQGGRGEPRTRDGAARPRQGRGHPERQVSAPLETQQGECGWGLSRYPELLFPEARDGRRRVAQSVV